MPTYYAKSILLSRTFWVNAAMILLAFSEVQEITNLIPEAAEEYWAALIAGTNVILRLYSTRPVALVLPNDTKPVKVDPK